MGDSVEEKSIADTDSSPVVQQETSDKSNYWDIPDMCIFR